jgi:hypothetical protein
MTRAPDSADALITKKSRGRPKGSKNKKKSAEKRKDDSEESLMPTSKRFKSITTEEVDSLTDQLVMEERKKFAEKMKNTLRAAEVVQFFKWNSNSCWMDSLTFVVVSCLLHST